MYESPLGYLRDECYTDRILFGGFTWLVIRFRVYNVHPRSKSTKPLWCAIGDSLPHGTPVVKEGFLVAIVSGNLGCFVPIDCITVKRSRAKRKMVLVTIASYLMLYCFD